MMFLKVNQEQSEIIVLIFRLSVANYGNFTRGLVTKYGVAAHSWLSRVVVKSVNNLSCCELAGRQQQLRFLLLTIQEDFVTRYLKLSTQKMCLSNFLIVL